MSSSEQHRNKPEWHKIQPGNVKLKRVYVLHAADDGTWILAARLDCVGFRPTMSAIIVTALQRPICSLLDCIYRSN